MAGAGSAVPLTGFAFTERRSKRVRHSYKHLAPLERKRVLLLHLKVEFTISKFSFVILVWVVANGKWEMTNAKWKIRTES
jgi:hypothetical protein